MKKILFFVLVTALLVVSACNNTPKGPDASGTFIGGNEGVKINFAQDAPPATIADNNQQSFDIVVEMNNKGEYTVPNNDATVKISGIPPDAFGVSKSDFEKNPPEDLSSRIKNPDGNIIEPATIQTDFSGLEYQYQEPGNQELPIRAEICYGYQTDISSKLCIKEKMTSTAKEDICQVNGNLDVASSGAPVQITKITQSGAGVDKTRFTFTIANVDTGKVFKDDSTCDETVYNDKNKVFVQINDLLDRGASKVDCTGLQGISATDASSGYVTLNGGTPRDVSCTATFPEGQRTNRLQPFSITLKYKYWEYIDSKVLVQYTPKD